MSTRYVLSKPYRLRGWYKLPMGLYSIVDRKAIFASKEDGLLLLKCDGAHDLTADTMSEAERATLEELLANEVVRPALPGESLKPEQAYKSYPARYRESVHWSITGACNLKCRHCFMSAPNAKHGSPAHEQLMDVVEQLVECGVCSMGITGGEPLVRKDFLDIVDALVEREIAVSTIYTNGWLDDEVLLDELEKRGVRAGFQLSFDGVGCHDFLRGVSGAEEKTLAALGLLRDRGCITAVSMCLHRGNVRAIRESVKLMASLGVTSMKMGAIMDEGEWLSPEVRALALTPAEEQPAFEAYLRRCPPKQGRDAAKTDGSYLD